jgi:hypothetical protein
MGYLFVVIGLLYWIFGGDSPEPKSSYAPSTYSPYYDSSSESDNDYYDYDDEFEADNPYDDGTGHYAGYEWAEENDVDDCDGNSNSFIEGCEEYVSEKEDAQDRHYDDEYEEDSYGYDR